MSDSRSLCWLVTGGAGFIGCNFVREALAADPALRVVNLDALTYAGNPQSLVGFAGEERHELVAGNIGDPVLVQDLLRSRRPDAIVNFAAETHVDRSIDGPAAFVTTNVVGTLNLLERTRDYWREMDASDRAAFRFLHVSTDEVYGSLGAEGRFRETTPYAPNSPYAASKASSDHLVRAFHHTYGLPVLTTNCSNNYGPFQFPEKLVPLVIQKALAGEPLPIYGDGRNVRDWLYVSDHCRAILRVLADGRLGEMYNIGGDAERENIDVVGTICALLDARAPLASGAPRTSLITYVADRPGHDRRYAIDATKIRSELGWTPQMGFELGMAATVDWYLDNAPWIANVLDGSYRMQRLGEAAA